MLKQDSHPPEQPAGQVRVKKEEFARALAALEARRQAEAQELEGTVVIGDVLQQLQINLPADEILQEIEALHTEQSKLSIPSSRSKKSCARRSGMRSMWRRRR